MKFINLFRKTLKRLFCYYLVFGLILLVGCAEDDDNTTDLVNQNPLNFTVTVSEIFGTVVNLEWNAAIDPDGDEISYSVILEGEEITSALQVDTFSITDLIPRHGYAGKVIANDGKGGVFESNFAFNTSDIVIEWQSILGGAEFEASSVMKATLDGGYIVGGYANSADGDVEINYGALDFWVIKLTNTGEIQWQRNIGGSLDDILIDINETKEGDYLLAGNSYSNDHDLQNNFGKSDAWIVKLDINGNLIWQTNLGGSDIDRAHSIKQTTDGGIIVGAMTHSNDGDVSENNGNSDCWIVKLDGGGSLVWETTIGGSHYDRANSVHQTEEGNYIMLGVSYSDDGDVSGNYGDGDYWVVKLDPFGEIIWEQHFGGSDKEAPKEILPTVDDGFIVSGNSESSDGNVAGNYGSIDYWVVKLDANGNVQWENHYGGSKGEFLGSIYQTNDKGFIISGYSYSSDGDVSQNFGDEDVWIVKIDNMGRIIWETSIGGSSGDFAGSIRQVKDGGHVFAGYTGSDDGDIANNNGGFDYLIMKIK